MTGGGFSNSTYVPGQFVINYGGSSGMTVTRGTDAYAVINAPNAALTFHGFELLRPGDRQGGTSLYWDTSLITPVVSPPANTKIFDAISIRELSYQTVTQQHCTTLAETQFAGSGPSSWPAHSAMIDNPSNRQDSPLPDQSWQSRPSL